MQTRDVLVAEPVQPHKPLAFREVVERYKRAVYYFALDLTGNHHDAEDLSQEVFIKAYRALGSFRGEASLKSWLFRIAVNTYLNNRRKKALAFMQLWDDFAGRPGEQSGSPQPDQNAERSTIRQHVDQALEKLSPKERTAFVLRYYNDCSLAEVAEAMAVAEGTVKSLLFRAVQKMRKGLAFYRKDLGLDET